jgi:hypothetical protein
MSISPFQILLILDNKRPLREMIFNLDSFKYISREPFAVLCENEFVVAAWIGSVFRVCNGLRSFANQYI